MASRQLMLTDMNDLSKLAVAATDEHPGEGLRAIAALRRLLDRLEDLHVERARDQGWSWQEIAGAMGVSKQTVHRKHGRRFGR
jgi:DNA-directed RNA polymerase specialized sigma24 family protein